MYQEYQRRGLLENECIGRVRKESYSKHVLKKPKLEGTGSGYIPRLISLVESSPPYDPNQPATASISTP